MAAVARCKYNIGIMGYVGLIFVQTAAIFWTFAGVIVIMVVTLALAKGGRRSAEYAFTHFEVNNGWVPGWAFMVGLLHAGYATSSTGMIIS